MENQKSNKPCIKCGSTKRYPAPPGRKVGQCIKCQQQRYEKNKEHILNNVSDWQKQNKAKVKNNKTEWKKRNPEKVRAHSKVKKAIEKGFLSPLNECICIDCGKEAKEYHHEDYSKPLDVIPVCISCHNLRHKNNL